MQDLILHHFDQSPFAEKARLMMGLKDLAWRSVQIPMIMPKPDLMPLTGGYRKTPVLQIGADVYCDTQLIARELERRFPEPTLFPSGGRGLAYALSLWSDKAFFEPGAGLSMGENKNIPEPVLADRTAFFNFMDFDVLDREIPHLYSQLMSHAALIEAELAGGGPYLSGERPGLIDISAYFPVWMCRGNIPKAGELFAPLARMAGWEERVKAIGHGHRREMDAKEALDIAKRSEPAAGAGVQVGEPLGLTASQAVSVAPDDYGRDPVAGRVETATVHEISIRRQDPLVGEVVVHFPRMGYRVLIS
jgi:glutathione S-transferase